ncbi:MAG: Gfo/Idh/MocA family oxidoreductase [Pseudomonadota bacterium]
MSESKTRIGIVGLGTAAQTIHLPACSKLSNVEIVGGVDPGVDQRFDFPRFKDVTELIRATEPQVIIVATPPNYHLAGVSDALAGGCHVFCEKPFMNSLADARAAIAAAEDAQRWVVINNEFRFMQIHRAAQQMIGKPEFGRLRHLSASQTFLVSGDTEAGWRGQDPRRTGKEFGIHVFDLCRFFFAEEPSRIYARMPRPDGPATPDLLNIIELEFSGDRAALIELDRLSKGRHQYLNLRLDGERANVETRIGGALSASIGIRGGTRKPYFSADIAMGGRADLVHGERTRRLATDPLDLFANATSVLLGEMLDAIANNRPPPCNAADNINSLKLVFAAYESSAQRHPIDLASFAEQ